MVGPRWEPCRTPEVTGVVVEWALLTTVNWVRFWRKAAIQNLPSTPIPVLYWSF